ncbi:MAG: SMC-Scp complex subunit ScpB [Candidatus Zixiibacteriota bacterium]|nr:MAG: SMC-Scp complex subunit ScpB [candidate division Zixibacteria bacterium]
MNALTNGHSTSAVEALILASPEPLPARKIVPVIPDMTPAKVAKAVAELNNRYMETGSSFRIRELAGGYQFYILPEFVGYVEELFTRRRKMRLTRAALETAAIIAYKQPVTKSEIEQIRGVASDGVINNLLDKKMITITGRAKKIGRPLQYGTTDEFLKFFGLASLDDLPKMSEIEELIAASESKNQTELPLPSDEETPVKLNVADGTFDPASRFEDATPETGAEGPHRLTLHAAEAEETRVGMICTDTVDRQPVAPVPDESDQLETADLSPGERDESREHASDTHQ